MDWASATVAARRGRADASAGPIPLSLLLTARAVDALEPATVDVVDRGAFSWRGDSPIGDDTVLAALRVPGVRVLRTLSDAGGVPIGSDWPDVLTARFTASDAVGVVGPLLVRLVQSLDGLWSRAALQGYWTADQIGRVRAAVACGIIVVPSDSGERPPGWTADNAARFSQMVGRFSELARLYMQGKRAEAALAGEQAARDVAFWNTVADVTGASLAEKLMDSGDSTDGNGSWLSQWWSKVLNLWSSWFGRLLVVAIVVGIGYLVWMNRAAIAGLVGRKIDAAGRKPAKGDKPAAKHAKPAAPAVHVHIDKAAA